MLFAYLEEKAQSQFRSALFGLMEQQEMVQRRTADLTGSGSARGRNCRQVSGGRLNRLRFTLDFASALTTRIVFVTSTLVAYATQDGYVRLVRLPPQ